MTDNALWIRQPLAVFDPDDQPQGVAGGLVVKDGVIVERVAHGALPQCKTYETFDAADCVLLPGLINTHHHFYQTLTRAYGPALNKPLFEWLGSLYPRWQHLTEQMIDVSTRLASAELLLSGCTTTTDHHYVFSQQLTSAIDVQAAAVAQMGIRAVLTRGSMSLGQSAGGLPPDAVVQSDEQILRDSERLIEQWHDASELSMLQIALAPCSPFSVTPQLMRDSAALARQHGVLLHTHLAETEDENRFCLQQFGRRPLEHLDACDWLRAGTWLAHGIHFDAQEIQALGQAGVAVSHCPSSNMMLGSGICKVPELEQAGVAVGLGVDGSASNDHSNLMLEVRQALYLQRLRAGLPADARFGVEPLYTHFDALRLATSGGAALLGRAELGRLSVGCAADLALFKLDEVRFSGVDDPLAGLLLSAADQAEHVMVAGRWRVRNRELQGIDLPRLQQQHRETASALRNL